MPAGKPKAKRVKWTPEKDAWLKEYAPWHTRKDVRGEFNRLFGEEATLAAIKRRCLDLGAYSQIENPTRFKRGHASPNKGLRQSDFLSPEGLERVRASQFKKGRIPHNRKPIGSIRLDSKNDGQLLIKVRDGAGNKNYKALSRVVWEEASGREVPEAHMVMFADGDKTNFDPENLVAVPRAISVKLNERGYEWHDRASLEALVGMLELDRAIYKARTRRRSCSACGDEFEPSFPHQARCRRCIDAAAEATGKRRK